MKYNKKDKNLFEKVSNIVYLGMGLSLFSYIGYTLYQNSINPLFSNSESKAKTIERIIENTEAMESTKNTYIVNEEEFKKYLRK